MFTTNAVLAVQSATQHAAHLSADSPQCCQNTGHDNLSQKGANCIQDCNYVCALEVVHGWCAAYSKKWALAKVEYDIEHHLMAAFSLCMFEVIGVGCADVHISLSKAELACNTRGQFNTTSHLCMFEVV